MLSVLAGCAASSGEPRATWASRLEAWVMRRVLSPQLKTVHDLPVMVRARTWCLCLVVAGCTAARRNREPAGMGPSLLPPDLTIRQLFQTEDEAAKGACTWLWKNEPKAQRYEYCGFIVRDHEGVK